MTCFSNGSRWLGLTLTVALASCTTPPTVPEEDPRPIPDASVDADVMMPDCTYGTYLYNHPIECAGEPPALAVEGTAFVHSVVEVSGLSGDGSRVAFVSRTRVSEIGDEDGSEDLIVLDFSDGSLTLASPRSVPAHVQGRVWGALRGMSDDGAFVLTKTREALLPLDDTNDRDDIFVTNVDSGVIERASVQTDGTEALTHNSRPSISRSGRFVVWRAQNDGLFPGDMNGVDDVLMHDRVTGELTRASETMGGVGGNGFASPGSVSDDGRYVVFVSSADNFVVLEHGEQGGVFVKDMETGEVEIVSVSSGGEQANRTSGNPDISADGRYVVFSSTAGNLVAGDTNGAADIFLHDRDTGETTRISVRSDGSQVSGSSNYPRISADGSRIIFSSEAFNLTPDTTGLLNVFVHEVATGETRLVSRGLGTSSEVDLEPKISSDGEYAAYLVGETLYVASLDD